MDNITRTLIKLVSKKGAPVVSEMLGHDSTHRVQRWFKNRKIPTTQLGNVRTIFILKGVLK